MKVKIVKEVKRSDGLRRFACGDVYPQSTYVRTICREVENILKYAVFRLSHKNHRQTSVLELEKPSENNQS